MVSSTDNTLINDTPDGENLSKRATEIADEIRRLERELRQEIQRIRIDSFEIREKTIQFKEEVLLHHSKQVLSLFTYIRRAKLKHIISLPIIWLCLLPAVLMDVVVCFYQFTCFPLYGIPKVRRADHVIFDRRHLRYLNVIEKLNCLYCSYFNGVVSFASEVGARTEQYWCPIKHAAQLKSIHSRYHTFVDFGDSDQYRAKLPDIRKDFSDIKD
jgi:hypothetical protein